MGRVKEMLFTEEWVNCYYCGTLSPISETMKICVRFGGELEDVDICVKCADIMEREMGS